MKILLEVQKARVRGISNKGLLLYELRSKIFLFIAKCVPPSPTLLYSLPFSLWKRSNILICDVKLYGNKGEEESEEGGCVAKNENKLQN